MLIDVVHLEELNAEIAANCSNHWQEELQPLLILPGIKFEMCHGLAQRFVAHDTMERDFFVDMPAVNIVTNEVMATLGSNR